MPKIKFIYLDKYYHEVSERPAPSKEFTPEWFRKMDSYDRSADNPDGKKLLVRNRTSNASAKKCTPMLDAIQGGYTIPLWSDVQVTGSPGQVPRIDWRVSGDVFSEHGPSARKIPQPPGYGNTVFKYLPHFKIVTPPGYSILVKPVAGHYDLPFVPVSAIVDTDRVKIDTNFPVWVKDGFDGVVEKGTPIAQVFPFKRQDWDSEFDWMTPEQHTVEEDKWFNSNIVHNYTRNIWSRKNYK